MRSTNSRTSAVRGLSDTEKAWTGALVAGEGSLGYMRGRVYISGGRAQPILGPGDQWYPRMRIEMMDELMIRRAADILAEKAQLTTKGTWLVVRVGQPVIEYLRMIREFMPGIRGTESDYIVLHGSPVERPVVDEYIRLFR